MGPNQAVTLPPALFITKRDGFVIQKLVCFMFDNQASANGKFLDERTFVASIKPSLYYFVYHKIINVGKNNQPGHKVVASGGQDRIRGSWCGRVWCG